jgi:hypothetical protein
LEEDGSFKWGKKKEKRVNKESEPGFGRKGKEEGVAALALALAIKFNSGSPKSQVFFRRSNAMTGPSLGTWATQPAEVPARWTPPLGILGSSERISA